MFHTEVVEKMEHKSSRENRTCFAQYVVSYDFKNN